MLEKPHKKLDVWKRSVELVKHIYELTHKYPKSEAYGLTKQMRRSAVSVPANIAEGAARNTKKEFVQFLHMSQGSLSELDTHLEISRTLGYTEDDHLREISGTMTAVDKMLSGLIKSIKNAKK